ncbi:hypothetical protein [Curvibacter phage PCA1]|nr:hypothetical protein [Curvibacter phage PCA1]
MSNHAPTLATLLSAVSAHFTREDDLPDGLLPKITEALQAYEDDVTRLSDPNVIAGLYTQRNELAVAFAKAALAAGWLAGRGFDDDKTKDWGDEWRHVVYVALPDGQQVSWHIAPTELHLLDGLPQFTRGWDGTYLGRTPGWSKEVDVVNNKIDPRWANIDFDKVNAEIRNLHGHIGRLQAVNPVADHIPDVRSAIAAFASTVRAGMTYEYESYLAGYEQGKYDEGMHQGPPTLTPLQQDASIIDGMPNSKVERELRRMLCALRHPRGAYFDDGEASYCGDRLCRGIDYMRETPEAIRMAWIAAGQKEMEQARPEHVSMFDRREIDALLKQIGYYANERAIDIVEAAVVAKVGSSVVDAKRYRKLQNWMSSNVKEGWLVVEQLGALAAWEGWDVMDGYLDSLGECNVGLCERREQETKCSDCKGTGADNAQTGEDAIPCGMCSGTGKAQTEPDDELSTVEHQLLGLMGGEGASEDHQDVRDVFRKARITERTIDTVFERIIPTSDFNVAGGLTKDRLVADRAEFNRAINFAIDQRSSGHDFLRAWREGDTSEWPEFQAAGVNNG